MNPDYKITSENNTHLCLAFERSSPTDTITYFALHKFLLPIILVTLFARGFHLVLKPLGLVIFVPQMIAGIILGPSVMGKKYKKLSTQMFSPLIVSVVNCFDWFGMVYMIFSICARVDISIVKKSGRLAIILGIGSCVIPMLVTSFVACLVRDKMEMDEHLRLIYHIIGTLECLVNFPVIVTLLTDLKILNSELGRLTLSTSLINGTLGLILNAAIASYMADADALLKLGTWLKHVSVILMIYFAVYALRPSMKRMMRQTVEGQPLKHAHAVVIHLMVLGYSLFGEVTGNRGLLGSVIMGLATPVSPPMGSHFSETIEHLAWAVFMPCFLINVGRQMDLFIIEIHHVFAVELMVVVAMLTRLITIMLPSLYYKIPLMDAISLTLLLNTRGIYDVNHFRYFHELKLVTNESFVIMVLTSMLKSALFIPIVRYIYDSSRRYVAYRRHTLQHSKNQAELRIIACIHEPDDVSTTVNILQASNHPGNPIGVYVLKLEEYVGRFVPIIIPHRMDQLSDRNTGVNRMIKAFCRYEEENGDHVFVQCYTAIAPYATMQDDICLMAFEKSTSLVIIPFHKSSMSLKFVIKNVLNLAPCSVGIFYDRGVFMNPIPIFSRHNPLKVCVIFIGGPDDREALAYGLRMADNYKILLNVIQFTDKNQANISDMIEEKQDLYMINYLRASVVDSKSIKYLEESVTEGSDTIWILKSIGKDFDLILVGRNHSSESKVLSGLKEWNEIEELGVVGDVLVSSDFLGMASVMVIQQQASVVQQMLDGPKYSFK